MVKKDTNKIFIDIDGVISRCRNGTDYTLAQPNYEMIDEMNKLYDTGKYEITYYSARGSVTGIDWMDLTKKQLAMWGVKYHNLSLRKPFFWYLIDDRTINPHCSECKKFMEKLYK